MGSAALTAASACPALQVTFGSDYASVVGAVPGTTALATFLDLLQAVRGPEAVWLLEPAAACND
jgi:hypothetical protein